MTTQLLLLIYHLPPFFYFVCSCIQTVCIIRDPNLGSRILVPQLPLEAVLCPTPHPLSLSIYSQTPIAVDGPALHRG